MPVTAQHPHTHVNHFRTLHTLMRNMYSWHCFQSPSCMAVAAATTCSLIVSGGPECEVKHDKSKLPIQTCQCLFVVLLQLMMESFADHPPSTFVGGLCQIGHLY